MKGHKKKRIRKQEKMCSAIKVLKEVKTINESSEEKNSRTRCALQEERNAVSFRVRKIIQRFDANGMIAIVVKMLALEVVR